MTLWYPRIFSNFQNRSCCEKYLKDNKHKSLHLVLGDLSLDIICSFILTVFLELRSWKTAFFSEQIMSADKYPSIFSHQILTIVYLDTLRPTFSGLNWQLKRNHAVILFILLGTLCVNALRDLFLPWTLLCYCLLFHVIDKLVTD